MADKFLYETLDAVSEMGFLKKEIPDYLTDNLNPKFEPRPYQVEAFARFFHCLDNDFPGKAQPLHLLFNMATGSGKTLIMAGLMLYLYEKGYRNFLFFVNSTNIIEKTKDNFLNPLSSKYLFNEELRFGTNRVAVTPVPNFEGVNENDINICFTTIQKLHSDLTTEKENAITFEDFRKHRVVLIADEAHHINVKTKSQQELFESWENTVERIFRQNRDNLLLEFTATHDYETAAMVEKYRNKVINRYDLLQFRNDRFSKDVVIVQSDFDLNQRILQALILSQYKREVAAKYQIDLKPVILFKAERTIAQSKENKANFHRLIDALTSAQVTDIRRSGVPMVQRAFQFFDANGISDRQLSEHLRQEFQENYCLSVNDETEKETYQILVNTLEDRSNRIRAIFAVQKLNEGWDVLNLFDIVRCYERRDSGQGRIGRTTLSEAQLIGRGARYFPFVLPENNERFCRKFDEDLAHELRVIEELHYHSVNNSRYISEIRTALVAEGMMDEQVVNRELKLKEPFKETSFYQVEGVWLNRRRPKNYQSVRSFADLGVRRQNYVHTIATGQGGAQAVLRERTETGVLIEENRRDVRVTELGRNIVQAAIARNPFFTFQSLKRYFPHLPSMHKFITSDDYLGGLEITFEGEIDGLEDNPAAKLAAVSGLLGQIEAEIRQQITEYEGTKRFRPHLVSTIFKDKYLKFSPQNPLAEDDPQFEYFVADKDWFAFNTLYGTTEEKAFVRFLHGEMEALKKKYDEIYLLRNQGHSAIYNFSDGQTFQPDFVLCLKENNGESSICQLFIEPKGQHLTEHDRWKEEFLRELTSLSDSNPMRFGGDEYRLISVPFYNRENENQFRESLKAALAY